MAEKKEKQYVSDNAQLMAEWDWEKNKEISPSNIAIGSGIKVWWKCRQGHQWLAEVNSRNKGCGCPICAGKRVLAGFNDLATTHTQIASEWHPTKNGDSSPSDFTAGSGKKVWWLCKLGHDWESSVARRTAGDGCPYCSHHRVWPGFNDLLTFNPTVAAEWHPTRNGELTPSNVTCNSGKKVWWKCSEGHEWEAKVSDRNRNHGCPYCSGRKAIAGENDLSVLNPELIYEWCYEKNSIHPSTVKANSHAKVWWKCRNGHTWEAIVKNRVNGHGCPYCSGNKAYPGENDLLTKYPNLAKEWHAERNDSPSPIGVACYSNQKVWWSGICGHEWQDTPSHRVMGRSCPICNRQNKTSFPEQAIFYYLSTHYNDTINGYTKIFPGAMELDIYIPSIKIGIEYDGKAWHNTEKALEREKEKFSICQNNGIKLIRIKEVEKDTDSHTCDFVIYCDLDLNLTINKLLQYCSITLDVDVDRDRYDILEGYLSNKRKSSFAIKFPNESKEWHPTRNGTLSPNMFSFGSGENVWWICKNRHEWQMPINERSQGNGCPYCSNHRILFGFNDLQTKNPTLAAEWHPSKNLPLSPNEILSTSTYLAWWKCSEGHEWQAKVRDRARGRGCPYCANKKVLVGYNDLLTANPSICLEWDYKKNIHIKPTTITAGSSKKAWWICAKCGFEWEAKIMHRNRGSGCPKCANQKRVEHLIAKK